MHAQGSQPVPTPYKSSTFYARSIKIGSWRHIATYQGDLTAKIYYSKRKMIWEIWKGILKRKIEMDWSNIIGIRAILDYQQTGILQVELRGQPSFFIFEIQPSASSITWKPCADFTEGEASIWRRHVLTFSVGVLDKHYHQLLEMDPRLRCLSQSSFPSQELPVFIQNSSPQTSLGINETEDGSRFFSGLQYPSIMSNSTTELPQHSIISDLNQQFPTQNQRPWNQGTNFPDTFQIADNYDQDELWSNCEELSQMTNHASATSSQGFDVTTSIQQEAPQQTVGHLGTPFQIPMPGESSTSRVAPRDANNAVMDLSNPQSIEAVLTQQAYDNSIMRLLQRDDEQRHRDATGNE